MLVDANWLIAFIIVEVQFRQTHEDRFAIAHFKLRLDAAADNLLRWNSINSLRPRAHEFDAAAGNDEVLEAVCAQVGEHFEHRLISHVSEELASFRMLRRGDPVPHDLLEFRRRHARMRSHNDFEERVVAAGKGSLQITFEQRSERFLGAPLRCCGASVLTRSSAKYNCTGTGCSHHSVPSLSKVAMRLDVGTKSGEPGLVTFSTKETMDCPPSAVIPRWQGIGGF